MSLPNPHRGVVLVKNDRPLTNPHMEHCRQEMLLLLERYDLAGAVCLIDGQEMGFAYHLPATWNAFVPDDTLRLGFRVRAKSEDLGHDRAHMLLEGTAQTVGGLKDFGRQTDVWMQDLFRLLRKAGVQIVHRPFGGQRLPRLTNQPPTGRKG